MGTLIRNLRISMIGTLALIVLLAGAAMLVTHSQEWTRNPDALPFPMQAATMVKAVEAAPPDLRPVIVRAFNMPNLAVHLAAAPPQPLPADADPKISRALQRRLTQVAGRTGGTAVRVTAGENRLMFLGGNAWAMQPLQVVIPLTTGGVLVIDARRSTVQRVNGTTLALSLLAVTLVIGALSVLLLTRQLRPLTQLSRAVDRFGSRLELTELPDDGTREVRDLTNAFRLLQTRIRELVAGRTRMMAAIGHDLGTYLTRLRLRIDFIEDAKERALAERDIAEMQSLIAGTLALAQLDHNVEPAQRFDIAQLLEQRAATFAAAHGAVQFAGAGPLIALVRPVALSRAFDNLIANALKYGGRADVSAERSGGMAEVKIEDRGPGIPAEARQAVLEPFFRRDTARNLDDGSFGLGLAIVAEILKRHDADFSLEDRPGGGLTARIRLPLAAQA